jgi:parallel beta-helix repeat protein
VHIVLKTYSQFRHAPYTFDCNSISIDGGIDSNCIIHTTGRNLHALIEDVDFINGQIVSDYPDKDISPEVEFQGNSFHNSKQTDFVIRLSQIPLFTIRENEIEYKGLIGIDLQNILRTASHPQLIENNSIINIGSHPDSSIGINIYNYKADILTKNTIKDNDYGISCMRSSNVSITGNPNVNISNAQCISDNYKYQVKAFNSSFPLEVHFNKFTNAVSSYARIYHANDGSIPEIPPEEGLRNVQCNYWGTGFTCNTNLFPANGYDCDGYWPPYPCELTDGDRLLYLSAKTLADSGNFLEAKVLYDSVLTEYPASIYSEAAIKDLLGVEEGSTQNYDSLKQLYLSDSLFLQSIQLERTSQFMAMQCDLRMGNYYDAINWLEGEISTPFSYSDSICALIDLGFVNTLMAISGLKTVVSIAPNGEFLPKTRKQNETWYRKHLLSLFNDFDSAKVEPKWMNTDKSFFVSSFGPNPVHPDDNITIKIESAIDDRLLLELRSMDNKIVFDESLPVWSFQEMIYSISINHVHPGLYLIIISSTKTGDNRTIKISVY